MELWEISTKLRCATDNLFVIWLNHEENRIEHLTASNAMKAVCDHIQDIAEELEDLAEREVNQNEKP